MQGVQNHFPRRLTTAVFLSIPLLVFVGLKLYPNLDTNLWVSSWYTRVFYFYAASFASLVALVAALFASTSSREDSSPRSIFITFAFINLSAMMLISSIATPHVLIKNNNMAMFFWSLRLAFPLGAFAFMLANLNWSDKLSAMIVQHRRYLWLFSAVTLGAYALVAFFNPTTLEALEGIPPLDEILALLSIGMLLFSAYRTWRYKWTATRRINHRLAITMLLIAEAQFFQAYAPSGRYSWLLYQPIILIALLVAVLAILSAFKTDHELHASRYFAVSGSIIVIGISLIFGEMGTRWLSFNLNRTSVVALVLAQGALSFLILYRIVIYLNNQIREQTVALQREQRLRSELTQLIVHDLKSPLSVITSGINLLAKGNLGSLTTTQRRLLTNLEQSGQQILVMIDDLLDVERMETGALKLQSSTVNLVTLVREAVEDLKIVASTHKQNLMLLPAPTLPSVKGDKRLLQRVLNNLLSNALKFTPENGRIHVSLESDRGYLIVNFADDGPGIPEGERARIFEKFAQIEGAERRGAGLGLTFCKMVAEAHGGFLIAIESDMGGALFRLGLPIIFEPDIDEEPHAQQEFADSELSLKTF